MDNVTNYALGPSEMTGLYYYFYIYGHNDALLQFMLCYVMCAGCTYYSFCLLPINYCLNKYTWVSL